MQCSFSWSLSYFEFFMLNNLFPLEKALALADNSAQHLLISGESCSLFLGKCRFLIGICDPAQEQSKWGWGWDRCLGCSLPCPQLLWEGTALVQPIFRIKGVESECWNDLIGVWLGRGRFLDFTRSTVQPDGLFHSWHHSLSELPRSQLLVLWPNVRVKGNVLGMNIINVTAFLSSQSLCWLEKASKMPVADAALLCTCSVVAVKDVSHFPVRAWAGQGFSNSKNSFCSLVQYGINFLALCRIIISGHLCNPLGNAAQECWLDLCLLILLPAASLISLLFPFVLSFCQHEQDLGHVPSSTCRTSWNWHQQCLLPNILQFGERRRFYAICLFISYSRNYFYLGCYHDNRQTVKSSPNASLTSNCC